MNPGEIAQFGIEALKKAGAQKSQALFSSARKHELNVEAGEISLLRTTTDAQVKLIAIENRRRGIVTLNNPGRARIREGCREVLGLARASVPDDAFDIADPQVPESFDVGPAEPDLDRMYKRLSTFVDASSELFPTIVFENLHLSFTRQTDLLRNSNGVDLTAHRGTYGFIAMFTARDAGNSSSFNYSTVALKTLEPELMDVGSIRALLGQSSGQLFPAQLPAKFVGDVIITPDCLQTFLYGITEEWLGDWGLISGTSVFRDKLGKRVADPRFSLHSRPAGDEMAGGYSFTPDGFKTGNSTIIDRGILKGFVLSQFGAKKTGLPRAPNAGGCLVVDSGDRSYDSMVGEVKRGILMCRFSGGQPSDNGDFSAVAKNSYYIEDGKIRFPLTETMVSGNIPKMLTSINSISRERIDYGHGILPWISFSGLTAS